MDDDKDLSRFYPNGNSYCVICKYNRDLECLSILYSIIYSVTIQKRYKDEQVRASVQSMPGSNQ